jgi:tRNA pseudouridine55 synthase
MGILAPRENGFLVIDKPEGVTSHEVVQLVRRRLEIRKVGHLGTLDPLATGVLPLAIGKATRLIQFLKDSEKNYEGTICLGIATDTYDREGQILARNAVPELTAEQLQIFATELLGPQSQIPPVFSAKKIGGVPAYRLARRGKSVEIAPQRIVVRRLEFFKRSAFEIDFRIGCSAGTYVRSFASDFGKRLGCGAHLSRLRRISSGEFSLSQAIPSEVVAVAEKAFLVEQLIAASEVLKWIPKLEVDLKTKESLAHGRPFHWALPQGLFARPDSLCVFFEGELIGLVEPLGEMEAEFAQEDHLQKFQPRVVLV